jgi:hypothetical protein
MAMIRLTDVLLGVAVVLALGTTATPPVRTQATRQAGDAATPEATAALLLKVEAAVTAGSASEFLALGTLDPQSTEVSAFLSRWFVPGTTAAVVKERDRTPLETPEGAVSLIVEVLVEAGQVGRLATWRLDLGPTPAGLGILKVGTLGAVDGLYRLALDGHRQYRAHNLVVNAEDFELRMKDGVVYVADAGQGPTAAVLIGRSEMVFKPGPDTERRQLALYCGKDTLATPVEAAFLRTNPAEAGWRLPDTALTEEPVDQGTFARAQQIFTEQLPKSFGIDLADLSRESWSLVPTPGDFLAEILTRQYGTLTYAHASSDQEDITLFDRAHRRNIAVYASAARLATRGRYYDEDAATEYDVQDYQVDTRFSPDRFWLEGTTRLTIKIRAFAVSALTVRLADALTVTSVTSDVYGRLLAPRVRGHNSVVVNLPQPASQGDVIALTFRYAGRLEPQGVDRENVAVAQEPLRNPNAQLYVRPEPSYVYSNRSAWYAQGPVSDYATATIRFTVPTAFGAACSGESAIGSPVLLKAQAGDDNGPRKLHVFAAPVPVRYLACVVSRFGDADTHEVPLPAGTIVGTAPLPGPPVLPIRVTATARNHGKSRELADRAGEIAAFYASLMHDVPYPSLDVAVVEANVPGGHSPGYLVILNQTLPTTPYVWRDDPAAFDNYPDFYIAHEVAHQWWGQAVGWKNYHEQWLSEGFAQYFAILFARQQKGESTYQGLLRELAHWTLEMSDQGPVYLGYRLGYLKGGGRTFRALVYNKAALVLNMLQRMLGDEAFFSAIRHFYQDHRFQKAGTDDLQRAFEDASGRSLGRFFDRWILGQDLPSLETSWEVAPDGASVTVRLQQPPGRVFEFPVTVTLDYANGPADDRLVIVSDQVTTVTLPLARELRRVEVNRDHITPLGR